MLGALSSVQISAKADPLAPAATPVASATAPPPQLAPTAPSPQIVPPATPAVPVLPPEPSAPIDLPSPGLVPTPAPGVSRRTVALGAAGVAAVGAMSAVVFGVLALQNKSDYEKTPTYSNTDNGNNFAAYTDGCIALAVAAGITRLVISFTSPPPVGAVVAP